MIEIVIAILALFLIFFVLRYLKALFQRQQFLTQETRLKADRKYAKLLSAFIERNNRKPSKDEKFRLVITASHHVFPVKGRNSRRWMRGKRGHWKRQRVRKYLLEKHDIVKDYKMR
jgi:hypothetical protein